MARTIWRMVCAVSRALAPAMPPLSLLALLAGVVVSIAPGAAARGAGVGSAACRAAAPKRGAVALALTPDPATAGRAVYAYGRVTGAHLSPCGAFVRLAVRPTGARGFHTVASTRTSRS